MRIKAIIAATFSSAILTLAGSMPVHADVEFNNSVSFFNVDGTDPAEIYKSILNHSLKIDGKRTIASITTKLTQSGDVREGGNSCKVIGYKIKLDFVVARPRLTREDELTPDDRTNWEQMSAFIKSHEELHRQIWLSCAE